VLSSSASNHIVNPLAIACPKVPLFLFLLVGILAAGAQEDSPVPPDDVRKIARKVDLQYNNLETLKADFEESYRGAGIARTESGVLWLKRPGKMRWEYRSPREKLFITTGKTAFFYVTGEQQARKARLDKIDDLRSPLRYLLGKTKLEKNFEDLRLLGLASPGASFALQGVPKAMRERVRRVRLDITPNYRIERIVIEEIDGATTEFRFSNQLENVTLTENIFRFTPPANVQVIEGTDAVVP
jgi:outer membrane lipoprotein carrier protein